MNSNMALPNELEFLRSELQNSSQDSLASKFTLLESRFMDSTWIIKGLRYPINFKMVLSDNSLLTSPKNATLLLEIKYWIAIQEAIPEDITKQYSKKHTLKRIRHVLRIIDYFLLSDYSQTIATHGLSALTGNAFLSLAYRLSQYNCMEEQFYDWSNRIRRHLIDNFSHEFSYGAKPPVLAVENFDEFRKDFTLNLTDAQILNIRRNLYLTSSTYLSKLINTPKKLLDVARTSLYSNTLYGMNLYKTPAELKITSTRKRLNEKLAAPIRSKHANIGKQNFRLYISCLRSLEQISQYGMRAPAPEEFEEIAKERLNNLKKSDPKTYKSIPFFVGVAALRGSLEYTITYAEDILEAMLNVIDLAHKKDISLENNPDIKSCLSNKLIQAGVRTWTISRAESSGNSFIENLRNMSGLYELFVVLIGALQLMIGILTARRYKEICSITINDINEKINELMFLNGKSGFAEERITLSRPIPSICIKLLKLLYNFHSKLSVYGVSSPDAELLRFPDRLGSRLKSKVHSEYYDAIDLFCDYIQLPLNEMGQRYYLREHQLRRFFAQAFFWSSLGNVHTLRWMLGHTDPEHVYRYISDSVPGQVITGVKADFVTELLFHKGYTDPTLERLIEQRFHTDRFSILLEDEVRDYLELLISESRVTVEPHYYHSEDGNSYKFLVEVLNVT